MKKVDTKMDELRPEYDLESLQVRKFGPERKRFGGCTVQLGPDVAEVFPNSESVNEALRFLIRITRETKLTFPNPGEHKISYHPPIAEAHG